MKKIVYTFLIFYTLVSCKIKNEVSVEEQFKNGEENQLLITNGGDSLEVGYWQYHTDIDKSGFYENGYKVGEWIYKSTDDSASVNWEIFDNGIVKFNYPQYLRVIDSLEFPMLFHADIPDGNKFSYVVLLEYDLRKLNTTIYDYLYEVNQSRETGFVEVLESKYAEIFYFKRREVCGWVVVVVGE
jgi:hypothetical protein